jgi:hypothetical protein
MLENGELVQVKQRGVHGAGEDELFNQAISADIQKASSTVTFFLEIPSKLLIISSMTISIPNQYPVPGQAILLKIKSE